jgi:CBS domain-containing protein
MLKGGKTGIFVKEGGEVIGVITPTDVRRIIVQGRDPSKVKVREFMTACIPVGQNPCIKIKEDGSLIDTRSD